MPSSFDSFVQIHVTKFLIGSCISEEALYDDYFFFKETLEKTGKPLSPRVGNVFKIRTPGLFEFDKENIGFGPFSHVGSDCSLVEYFIEEYGADYVFEPFKNEFVSYAEKFFDSRLLLREVGNTDPIHYSFIVCFYKNENLQQEESLDLKGLVDVSKAEKILL